MGPGHLDNEGRAPEPRASNTEAILAEARRRVQEHTQQPLPPGPRTLAEKLTRFVYWLARHWLAVFNTLAGLYITGAIVPPVLVKAGVTGPANLLYTFYSAMCHQYPFRSWFLFGSQFAYPLTAPTPVGEMNAMRHYIGDAVSGYKIALCQRDVAIYGTIFLAGLVYAYARTKKHWRAWPIWAYFVFGIAPMMLDGGIQWISYLAWKPLQLIPQPFETIPLMRTLTGALFGFGIVATAYPYMNEYFEDVKQTVRQKLKTLSGGRVSNAVEQ